MKILSDKTLKELGFRSFWPSGNPTEPWWEHKELDFRFSSRPTAKEIFDSFYKEGERRGRSAVQTAIKEALND